MLEKIKEDDSAVRAIEAIAEILSGKTLLGRDDVLDVLERTASTFRGKAKLGIMAAAASMSEALARNARFIYEIERRLYDPVALDILALEPAELSKMWKNTHAIQFKTLELLLKVSDMTLSGAEQEKVADGTGGSENLLIDGKMIPQDPSSRDKLRTIVNRFQEAIDRAEEDRNEEDDGQ
jgi:hypothetical protein